MTRRKTDITNEADDGQSLAIWSMIEAGTGIIAASLVTLKPLANRLFSPVPRPEAARVVPLVYIHSPGSSKDTEGGFFSASVVESQVHRFDGD